MAIIMGKYLLKTDKKIISIEEKCPAYVQYLFACYK